MAEVSLSAKSRQMTELQKAVFHNAMTKSFETENLMRLLFSSDPFEKIFRPR
jgi:hypothetical protein